MVLKAHGKFYLSLTLCKTVMFLLQFFFPTSLRCSLLSSEANRNVFGTFNYVTEILEVAALLVISKVLVLVLLLK
jgi:hypothetical protein